MIEFHKAPKRANIYRKGEESMLKLTNVLDRISLIVIDATIVLLAVAKAHMGFYKDYTKKCLSVTVR